MNTNNAKNIVFRGKMIGDGIVNYDSEFQKQILYALRILHLIPLDKYGKIDLSSNNVKYAKKAFKKTNVKETIVMDGKNVEVVKSKADYVIIISSDLMRSAILGQDTPYISSAVGMSTELLLSFIASPDIRWRGFFITNGENELAYSLKTASYISQATQSNNALSSLQISTTAGERNMNSLRYKESVGDIEYKFHGAINLQELQFTSTSQVFGRQSFDPSLFERYCEYMKKRLPEFNAKLGHYLLKNSAVRIPELGYKMDNDSMVAMVKYLFKKMLATNIKRATAFAKICHVEYKIITNPMLEYVDTEEGWITLTPDNVDDISFNCQDFYEETTTPETIQREKDTIEQTKVKAEIKKEKKEAQRAEAKKKKEDKNKKS